MKISGLLNLILNKLLITDCVHEHHPSLDWILDLISRPLVHTILPGVVGA